MYAMEFDRTGRIMFSPVPIPEDVVAGLREEFGGHPLADLELDVPPDYNARPPGTDAPDLVLCVSRDDPRHYRVFRFAREIDLGLYDVAGRTWSVVRSEEQWHKFLRLRRETEAMARNATGVEAPEDAFDEDDVADLARVARGA